MSVVRFTGPVRGRRGGPAVILGSCIRSFLALQRKQATDGFVTIRIEWGLRFDSLLAQALELGPLCDEERSLPLELVEQLRLWIIHRFYIRL